MPSRHKGTTQSCTLIGGGTTQSLAANLGSLTSTITVTGNNTTGAPFTAFARVVYEMELFTTLSLPDPNVPVWMTASGSTSASGNDEAAASVFSGIWAFSACSPGGTFVCNLPASFGGSQLGFVSPGVVYQIVINASVDVAPGSVTASAFADPFIFIDPAFLALHPEYSLNFSANITNSASQDPPTVPEPATLTLVGVGLVAALRSRYKKAPKNVLP